MQDTQRRIWHHCSKIRNLVIYFIKNVCYPLVKEVLRMKFSLFLFMAIFMAGCSTSSDRTVASENTDATVMITNFKKNSGGSGVILQSTATESIVLTNAHVCGVVKFGGVVTSSSGVPAFVTHYKVSKVHDLCLISVSTDLNATTQLAYAPPKKYDRATISGHPKLLPNILTFGHFSDKLIVQVMTGSRECTPQEYADPDTSLFCVFTGHLPVVKTYESIVVSATIQPGSSGSGVFDTNHRLAALVFAGSGDLGYALAVPFEYIDFFITTEIATLPLDSPITTTGANSGSESDKKLFAEACKDAKTVTDKNTCKAINNNTLF